jgi:16S rRNA (cytosine967-C5)-methyltransferase
LPRNKWINKLLLLLEKFLAGEATSISEDTYQNPALYHYYKEILRYYNKINFILSYTLSALGRKENLTRPREALYIFIIYRSKWEKASIKEILMEISFLPQKKAYHLTRRHVLRFLNKLSSFSWKKALKNKTTIEKLSIIEATPTFFIEQLKPHMDYNFIKQNLRIMNSPEQFPLYFIINVKKASDYDEIFHKIEKLLSHKKIPYNRDDHLNYIYEIPSSSKKSLIKSDFYKNGDIIILDRGSIYIANELKPINNELICDMCAAPGMKTTLLCQYINDYSHILAADFNMERLTSMDSLLDLYGISNASLLNTDSIDFPLMKELKYDKILLDAPCTGSGTFSSNPELKWRQNYSFLHQNITLQEKLLRSALKMLKPKGKLIYSTCSLYPYEGEFQIQKFLDFMEPLPLPDYFSASYEINGNIIKGTGRLFPSIHSSKGFFIAKFRKSS